MAFTKGFKKPKEIKTEKPIKTTLQVTGTPPDPKPNSLVTDGSCGGHWGGNAT